MKIAISTLLVASAAAFAPAPSGRTGSSLAANVDNLLGALPPAGFFDPLKFAAKATDAELARFREVEIMHGRFAQMAALGMIVAEKQAHDGSFGADFLAPNGCGIDAFQSDPEWTALTLALIAGLEAFRLISTEPGSRVDAGIESIGWRPSEPDKFENMQVYELQNGRLAMLAFAGQVAQELVNQTPLLTNLQDNDFVSWW